MSELDSLIHLGNQFIDLNSSNVSNMINLKNLNNENELPNIQIEDIVNLEDITQYLEELKCPICFDIIDDASEQSIISIYKLGTCVDCEANFCNSCIKKWILSRSKKCPCCRNSGQNKFLYEIFGQQNEPYKDLINMATIQYKYQYKKCPKIFSKLLSTIKAQCHYKDCKTIFNYDGRNSHFKICKYHETKCPNQRCNVMVNYLTRESHANECKFKLKLYDKYDFHKQFQILYNYMDTSLNDMINQRQIFTEQLQFQGIEENERQFTFPVFISPTNRYLDSSQSSIPRMVFENILESERIDGSINHRFPAPSQHINLNQLNNLRNNCSQFNQVSSDDQSDEGNIELQDIDEKNQIPLFFSNISHFSIQKPFNSKQHPSNYNNNK